ncbi:MAG TPA: HAMP domain-containing sensor histidine kinase, partial [Chitinophagaceae bacterium]|nr:HAMP domain-containing sensor histidine kinase [Chitinophagaceae bacterium]
VFKNVMIISPSAEVYFLDTTGKVLDFYGSKKEVKLWQVSLKNIDEYITAKGQEYIKAPDPRDPSYPKIFSAAAVTNKTKKLGYIYVILGSNEYRAVGDMLFGSHLSGLAIKAFCFIILLSIILSLLYIKKIEKSFGRMINVLESFENGDLNARFKIKDNDELAPVSRAFNKMADMLIYNANKLSISEKERKEFITNITHDLRTPLTIARGYAETLQIKKEKGELTNNEQDNYMQMILKKVLQVQHMVEHLFEISKMEAGEYKLQKEPFVLSEIVQETVNTFQLFASEKRVKLKCTQCQYHVWINADIRLMERVIQNLVENAISSTPANGEIGVALEVKNNLLIFKIENDGPSLPDDLLQWINSNQNNYGQRIDKPGTGLGLAIAKKILSLHNSSLVAISPVNNSNKFSFGIEIYNQKN